MKKILVVDDDPHMFLMVSEMLARDCYEVSHAANGETAMRQVCTIVPDLVVLDLVMPGIDGIEVCRRIKDDPALKGVKIIMVTAKTEKTDIQTGLSAGADHYITKPYKFTELTAAIKELIG